MTALYRHNKDSPRYYYRIIWSRDSSSPLASAREQLTYFPLKRCGRGCTWLLCLSEINQRGGFSRHASAKRRDRKANERSTMECRGIGGESLARGASPTVIGLYFRDGPRLVRWSRRMQPRRLAFARDVTSSILTASADIGRMIDGGNAGIAACRCCSHKLWRGE